MARRFAGDEPVAVILSLLCWATKINRLLRFARNDEPYVIASEAKQSHSMFFVSFRLPLKWDKLRLRVAAPIAKRSLSNPRSLPSGVLCPRDDAVSHRHCEESCRRLRSLVSFTQNTKPKSVITPPKKKRGQPVTGPSPSPRIKESFYFLLLLRTRLP